jgi:hypothetical protein
LQASGRSGLEWSWSWRCRVRKVGKVNKVGRKMNGVALLILRSNEPIHLLMEVMGIGRLFGMIEAFSFTTSFLDIINDHGHAAVFH